MALTASFPEEEAIEEIDRRAHGAEPSAEEITEDDNEKENPECGKHPLDNSFSCEQVMIPMKGSRRR